MDVTPLFKACVKTVKTRNKALGIELGSDADRMRILQMKTKTEYTQKAKEIVGYITKLKEFLLEHRKDYVNSDHLITNAGMTDNERDQIDTETQNVIKQCSQNLKDFRTHILAGNGSPQHGDHKAAVVKLIEDYLKNVCKIYSEQKAIRIKRIVDIQKLSKLESGKQARKLSGTGHIDFISHKEQDMQPVKETEKSPSLLSIEESGALGNNETPSVIHDDLSPEEIQMFEQENKKLFEEFNSIAGEIKVIEGRVLEISKLQEIFAEKVLDQEKDIERVSTTVIGTTENIKDANEELREAMKKNAGFRVWILFFLLVLSFSLLFLDWYNP